MIHRQERKRSVTSEGVADPCVLAVRSSLSTRSLPQRAPDRLQYGHGPPTEHIVSAPPGAEHVLAQTGDERAHNLGWYPSYAAQCERRKARQPSRYRYPQTPSMPVRCDDSKEVLVRDDLCTADIECPPLGARYVRRTGEIAQKVLDRDRLCARATPVQERDDRHVAHDVAHDFERGAATAEDRCCSQNRIWRR